MLSNDAAWKLLRTLDEPDSGEQPTHFDRASTARKFEELVQMLNESFQCTCIVDAWPSVQDASYFGAVFVPAESTTSGSQLWARVSNFGSLVVYGLELPGACTLEEELILLAPADRDHMEIALEQTNHVSVPLDLLWDRYDGSNDSLKNLYQDADRPDWFIRFFDYL